MKSVRVRFAPSPTGPLHIGGVRTALFNYLFAKKHQGKFIVRIEDTDTKRYVEGAEKYIQQSLQWLSIEADESPWSGGMHTPYRQSERKNIYTQYIQKLVDNGHAYYAFDTQEDLEKMRIKLKESKAINQQYNAVTRMQMINSLTLKEEEVEQRLQEKQPYVIRFKVPIKEEIRFKDGVRSWVKVHSSTLDDKILVKSDGMPTYHFAHVVDDYVMKISHVIRGEEWLPSAPLHVLLYKALGWEEEMPTFAHLPLILRPDGKGKLSKRIAEQQGFPIYPLTWHDTQTHIESIGFKESGFLPESMLNFLAFLGWNPGTNQEFFSLAELIEKFTIEQINKSGAQFDIEKLKWYNQHFLKTKNINPLAAEFVQLLKSKNTDCPLCLAKHIVSLYKERITFLHDLVEETAFFFQNPNTFEEKVLAKKLNAETFQALQKVALELEVSEVKSEEEILDLLHETLASIPMKLGQIMQLLRIVTTGRSGGPDLIKIFHIMGAKKVAQNIHSSLKKLAHKVQ